ncbi:MAG TPA: HAMP domain-containing sensor histidine kinase [Opitutaceae bacterium]|nr:HAMP domain-containing sensor histidine kinase [Opitutaceae bacterium]
MPSITLLTSILVFIVGIAIAWRSPRRTFNQAFLLFSIVQTLWLLCVWRVMEVAETKSESLVFWLRANAVVGAFVPIGAWCLKESLIVERGPKKRVSSGSLPWILATVAVMSLCFLNSFIVLPIKNGYYERGLAYVIYNAMQLIMMIFMAIEALIQINKANGIRRIELTLLVFNVIMLGIFLGTFNLAGNLLKIRLLNRASILVVFFYYLSTGWMLTAYRIFEPRQIFLALGQRVGLLLLVAAIGFELWTILSMRIVAPFGLLISLVICSALTVWLDGKSRSWLDLEGRRVLAVHRRRVIEMAHIEPDAEKLAVIYEKLLCGLCRAPRVALLFDSREAHVSSTIEFSKQHSGHAALRTLGWATPEGLERSRPAPGIIELERFLSTHGLGLIITAPRGSPNPSLLVAAGVKLNGWPFTYPEIQHLQNIAELMDNILTHARVTADAALKAKAEHLAMMSRGLAHDLKNLITPVSSFLVHTDGRFPEESAEGEVHAAAKRSIKIMTDYVREALFFSERLAPRFERIEIETVFDAVRDATANHAERRGVALRVDAGGQEAIDADPVLLQRMFANLVNNAIDASQRGRIVALTTALSREGWVRVQVTDQGCGIPPENVKRIFEPYFTTKEFGDEVRGFGLGLSICERIVQLHHGFISVESKVGEGTTMSVDLPITQGV